MVFRMRKCVFALIILGLVFVLSVPGLCQGISLDTIFASVEIPDSYTILTPENMETNNDFLQARGTTTDVMLQTFRTEGILLQAYGKKGDTCLQITALEDVDAKTYFDIDQQTPSVRAKYRREHLDGAAYELLGISYDSAEWRNTTAYGRFLMLKYVQRLGGKVDHRGFARRTIRNGYTITVDYQVFGRGITAKDNNALNDVMDTWRFTKVLSMSNADTDNAETGSAGAAVGTDAVIESASGMTEYTQKPPEQTNDASFTVEGITTPGAEVSASVLHAATMKTIVAADTASKSGKFALDVTLPQEGVYIMALTVTVNGKDIDGFVFPEITYDKTLLPVRFNETFPEEITQNKFTFSGVTDSAVQIELNVNGDISKKKSNAKGEFSFTVNTAKEGTYTFDLTFSKKGLEDQHVSFNAQRTISYSEERAKIREEAIKPAHSTLTSKIKGYTGRIMGYNAYVKEIQKSGDAWVVFMAFRQTKSGYRDIIVVATKDEPSLMVDTQVKMYGQCTGMYQVQDDNGVTEYPSFDLLFWDN